MASPKDDDERVMLQNPNTGRDDARIRRRYYDPVREAILAALGDAGELRLSDLYGEVEQRTSADLWEDGSVGWYTMSVKLDLEAKGLIEKFGKPQKLRLAS